MKPTDFLGCVEGSDAADFALGAMIFDDISREEKKDERKAALEDAGLDEFDLDMMSTSERRRALDDAGLDPDDYDYL